MSIASTNFFNETTIRVLDSGFKEGRQGVKETVARLMDEARRRAGQDVELARLIEPLVGRTYGKQVISAWALGRAMPPAVVLLAACKVTGISIDAALFGEGALLERMKKLEDEVAEIRQERPPVDS